jgi:hypothetical protein
MDPGEALAHRSPAIGFEAEHAPFSQFIDIAIQRFDCHTSKSSGAFRASRGEVVGALSFTSQGSRG